VTKLDQRFRRKAITCASSDSRTKADPLLWQNAMSACASSEEGEITADVFGFLTCEPNADVERVHPKAMPVILATAERVR